MGSATVGNQGKINHFAIVMDESGSMWSHEKTVPDVVDALVANLAAEAGLHPDQETRITVYTFNTTTRCVYYDKDVLRLPSLKGQYRPSGGTGMIDATLRAMDDLSKNPELYGDHANLVFVLTDGEETQRRAGEGALRTAMSRMRDNFTLTAVVPDERSRHRAKNYGFPEGNIAVWDATSAAGVKEAGQMLSRATSTYMDQRETGMRSSRTVFSVGADALNGQALAQSGVTPLRSGYQLVKAIGTPPKLQIKDFVEGLGHRYTVGMAYYQLIKTEKIQGNKRLAVMNKKTKEVFVGTDEIRALIGLGTGEQRVRPDINPDFVLFVQSSSVNRHVVDLQDFILMGI